MPTSEIPKEVCFIVGAPRSGTTWFQRLLTSHPAVCGGEESHFFALFDSLRSADRMYEIAPSVGPLCYVEKEKLEDAIRHLWLTIFEDLYSSNHNSLVHVEKTPFHALVLDEIVKVFPTAKIILLTRDSRAAVASMVAAGTSWGEDWAPDNYSDAAIMWWRHVNSALNWHEQNPDHPFLILRYEDAIDDVENTLRKALEFMLPEGEKLLVDQTLDLSETKNPQANEPAGFSRIRGKSGWKKDMSFYGRFITWRYTRKLMRKLGYDLKVFS